MSATGRFLSGLPAQYGLDFATTSLAAGSIAVMPVRTCFCGMRKSSMFVDMPLDNRTVDQIAAGAALLGSLDCLKQPHRQTKRSNISLRMIVL